jgi:hypothetical protein
MVSAQALRKNKKKRCYTYLLHFSTCKHNLVSFFSRPNRILTVELHRSDKAYQLLAHGRWFSINQVILLTTLEQLDSIFLVSNIRDMT